MTHAPTPRRRPELLAPAGDWDCAAAAIENGADAIYFGLDCGFNARYRAANFGLADLDDLMTMLRTRGVRGYVTMNTLAFPSELPKLAGVIQQVAAAGVDAVLVQDFGVARMASVICPSLEIHASTQMSLTSAETIAVAERLGLARVVVARELSVAEIRKITDACAVPIEVFIHGALCVAYSGQCLTSEALGGRSANRGQCAQACRLPYEIISDGQTQDLDDIQYLLSPQDLAGYAAIPELIDAGVASLKIEGRLKTPEYVANITSHYRRAIDQAVDQGEVVMDAVAVREMELSFSRGFSPGWLQGNDHKALVPGLTSAKQGVRLGRIRARRGDEILVDPDAPIALGDGVAIDASADHPVQGGRIYSLHRDDGTKQESAPAGRPVWIGFGRGEIAWDRVNLDSTVYKNDDPKLNKRLRKSFQNPQDPSKRKIDVRVRAVAGEPLVVEASLVGSNPPAFAETRSDQPLSLAHKRPAQEADIREKIGRLGNSDFQLRKLQIELTGRPMVPASWLNQARRNVVEQLQTRLARPPERQIDSAAGAALIQPLPETTTAAEPSLVVLCRNLEQLTAAVSTCPPLVYADFHDVREYRQAVQVARDGGVPIALASIRMQKPGEMGLLKALTKHRPDFVLARNLAAIDWAQKADVPAIADFSLNVANHRAAEWIHCLGARRVTASYDLNRDQLNDFIDATPSDLVEVVVHQHIPMFHMEHCVFCSVLSPGTNKTNCGRPCDDHVVQLRDRVGAEHVLQADIACRNTLYNAAPQSGAEIVDSLRQRGIQWFRIEMLQESARETRESIRLYRQLLAGSLSGRDVWQRLAAKNQVGVTRGTLEPKRNPLAIL